MSKIEQVLKQWRMSKSWTKQVQHPGLTWSPSYGNFYSICCYLYLVETTSWWLNLSQDISKTALCETLLLKFATMSGKLPSGKMKITILSWKNIFKLQTCFFLEYIVFMNSWSVEKDESTTHQQNFTKRQKMWLANHQWDRLHVAKIYPNKWTFQNSFEPISSLPSSFSMFNAATAYRGALRKLNSCNARTWTRTITIYMVTDHHCDPFKNGMYTNMCPYVITINQHL